MWLFRRLSGFWVRAWTSFAVKEAFDNLPSGICFFNTLGLPVLCNYQMHRLYYMLAGSDLQSLADFSAVLERPLADDVSREGDVYVFPDGRAWRFARNEVQGVEDEYIEYVATDVTVLRQKYQALRKSNDEQRKMIERIRSITANLSAIAKEEELLAMKMRIHNELGCSLQAAKHYWRDGCPPDGKEAFLANMRRAAAALSGEADEVDDVIAELRHVAKILGVEIVLTGELPTSPHEREIVAAALRENITNTVRHAEGNRVFIDIRQAGDLVEAYITNNGKPPPPDMRLGGGLASLRQRVEKAGGELNITAAPVFRMELKLYRGKGELF